MGSQQSQAQIQHTIFLLRMKLSLIVFCLVMVSFATPRVPPSPCYTCVVLASKENEECKFCVSVCKKGNSTPCLQCVEMYCPPCVEICSNIRPFKNGKVY